jgi:GNAT superfamily N-acetyltransferase
VEYKMLNKSDFGNWIDQFCHLYQKCFSATINEDIVKWRYLENPLNELLICIAVENGKLVASSAASPCEIVNKGYLEKSAISLNLMTDPEYRGRGLFVDLVSKLYKYMEIKNYKSVLGFPNSLSNPTFISKLGRKTIYEIPTLELKLSGFRDNLNVSSEILEDDSFIGKYPQYSHIDRTIYLNKNREYLKWRYLQNPQNTYKNFVIMDKFNKVKSFLICKEYNDQLNIVDYYYSEKIDIELLIYRAIKYAKDIGKALVTVWSQTGTVEHLFFQKQGFRNNYPITYFSGKLFGEEDNFNEFYDYRNWYINMGDDNVY